MDRLEQATRIMRQNLTDTTQDAIALILLDIAYSLRQMAAPIEDVAEPEPQP